MRRLIEFSCAGETLVGTLDEGPAKTGLLIVSGGNELRMGAHRGMAMLAARLAAELHVPVFRFDRRGIGDSTGVNRGFDTSAPDIAAAVAAFRAAAPQLERIAGFGNCDAATALALFHRDAGVDTLVLANPWIADNDDGLPPATAIRARYAQRIRDPRQWLRLLRGGVNLVKLFNGLCKTSRKPSQVLASRMGAALGASDTTVTLLLSRGDNTAIAFREAWKGSAFDRVRLRAFVDECDTDSHSFAHAADKAWLFQRLMVALLG